jgi:hypothetical protein
MSNDHHASSPGPEATPDFAGLPLNTKSLERLMSDLVTHAKQTTEPLTLTRAVLDALAKKRVNTTDS